MLVAKVMRCDVCIEVDISLDVVRPAELLKKANLFYYRKLQNVTLVLKNVDVCC